MDNQGLGNTTARGSDAQNTESASVSNTQIPNPVIQAPASPVSSPAPVVSFHPDAYQAEAPSAAEPVQTINIPVTSQTTPITPTIAEPTTSASFPQLTAPALTTPQVVGVSEAELSPAAERPEALKTTQLVQSLQEKPMPTFSRGDNVVPPRQKRQLSPLFRRAGVAMLALLLIGGGAWFLVAAQRNNNQANNSVSTNPVDPASRFQTLQVPLNELASAGSLVIDSSRTLSINGQLRVNNSLIMNPTNQPVGPVAGQMYYDQANNVLAYYNGSSFVDLRGDQNVVTSLGGATGAVTVGSGLGSANGSLTNTGVLSVQGQTGAVTFTNGSGIAITGTTLSNTGVLSLGGQTGDVTVGNGLNANNGTLQNTGVLSVASGSANISVTNDGSGNVTISSSASAGTGTVSSSGGTTGHLAKFTGVQTIADSLVSESGTAVTIGGNLSITGTVTLGSALSVANGGTGATSLTNNGVVIGQGTSGLATVSAGAAGQCLVSTVGAPTFQACPGSGGVSSLNGLNGALTLANASGAGSTITINDASTLQKGIAQFNSSNFTSASGVVNTIQNISSSASPTFAGLTLTSPLTVANGGTSATTAAGARTNLGAAASGPNSDITSLSGLTTALSIGQGGTGAATASGARTNLGAAASGTNGDITATTALNTITPSGALAIGATSQSFLLQGNTSSSLTATSGANTTTIGFTSPTANVTINFPALVAGTYSVCTTSGNCAGSGGGVTTPGGTAGVIPKFTGSQTLANSIISDNGTTITISGAGVIQGNAGLTVGNASTTTGKVAFANATNANTLTLQSGVTASNLTFTLPTADGTNSQCLSTNGSGVLSFETCLTGSGSGSGVISFDSLSGALTLANSSGAGSTVTIDNASTTQKGIAQFNSTNFTASSGTINTIQDIATTASPTFASLTLSSPLTVPNGGTGGTSFTANGVLYGNGSSAIQTTAAAANSILATNISNVPSFTQTLPTPVQGNITSLGAVTAGSIGTGFGAINTTSNITTSLTVQGGIVNATSGFQLAGTSINTAGTLSNVAYLNAVTQTFSGINTFSRNGSGTGDATLAVTGTPINDATSSLVRIANAIASGNAATNGGTYIGLNEPSSGAGSAADFLNFQQNGTSTFEVTGAGAVTANSANTTNGYSVGGTSIISSGLAIQNATGVTSSGTITFSGLNAVGVVQTNSSGVLSTSNLNLQTGPVTGVLQIVNGGTGANNASNARMNLSAAQSGANGDITSTSVLNTITPTNTLTVGATSQAFILQGNKLSTITATDGSNVTTIGFVDPTATTALNFPALAAGTYSICTTSGNCSGAGGGVTTPGGTANALAKFTGSQTLGNSSITDNGTTVTLAGSGVIQGASGLTVGVGSATTGKLVLQNATNNNTLTLQSGVTGSNISFTLPTADGSNTQCLSTNGSGTLAFESCLTGSGSSGGVSSLDGLVGVLTLANSSGAGSTVTINDASTSQKGIAQFNSTNFTASGGTINTVQDIATSSSPSFTALNLTGSSGLTVGTSTTLGKIVLKDGNAATFGVTIQVQPPLTTNQTLTVPDATGTICLQSSASCGFAASSGSSNYIQNQNSSDQSASFRITGSGRANTSILTPLLDTASATALNIGTTNATGINLNQNTVIASNKSFVANGSATFTDATNAVTAFQVQNANTTSLIAADTTAPASNLLTNPGFEVNTSGWQATGTGASVARNTTASNTYASVASLAVTLGSGAGTGAQITSAGYSGGSLAAGTYTLGFYAKGSASLSGLAVSGFNGGTCTLNATTVPTAGFQHYTCTLTTTGATTGNISITVTTGSQTLYIDGAQLVSSSSLLPFAYGTLQYRGTVTTPLALQNTANSTTAFQIQDTSNNSLFNVDTLNDFVGVGTANPTSRFTVQGGDIALYNNGNSPRVIVGDSGASGHYGYFQWDSTNNYFRIETAGTNGVKINDNNVAIGNLFPNEPLIVGSGSTKLFDINSTGIVTLKNSLNSTAALNVQNTSGNTVTAVDTTNSQLVLGQASTLAGQLLFNNASNANTIAIQTPAATANRTITLPDATGTICLQSSASCGFATSSGSGSYVQNQNSVDQTANFRITGTGQANTSILTPLLDTASAIALNIGTTNATAINLNQNTVVASNKSFTANGLSLFKDATNATNAFQVQNSSAANLFTVDTTNGNLVLGNDGTPTALTVRGGAATGTSVAGANLTVDASNGTGLGGSGDLILRTAAPSGGITFDTSTTANQDSFSATLSWTHTATTNGNRAILVSFIEGSGDSVQSVTYGAATLSLVSSSLCASSNCRVELWGTATSVPSGANTVTATWTSARNHRTAGAMTFYNVNTSSPFGTAPTPTTGSSSPSSITVSSTNTQQLVVDAFGFTGAATWTPGSGQTQAVNQNNATNGTIYSSYKTGVATTTSMSWTTGSATNWGQLAVAINAAVNSTPDTLTDRLHIAASGNVGINTATPAYTLDVQGDVNTSTTYRIGGASINTAGTLSNVAYLNAASQTFTGVNSFSRNGTGASDATLAVTGTPVNNATSSLIRIGNSIASGNTTVNGGTYIGLNEPSSGAGSVADFLNFQQNGTSTFSVTGAGTATAATSVLTPLLDTASAVALNIGTTNATAINLNQNTVIANNKSFTANGTALFKDATNTTTAFQVQDASANVVLNADTTNDRVGIGTATPSTKLNVVDTLFSDNFNRANNSSLGSNWTKVTDGGSDFQIVSNQLKMTSSDNGATGEGAYTTQGISSANYSVQSDIIFPSVSDDWMAVMGRASLNGGSDTNGYYAFASMGQQKVAIYKRVGTTWTQLSTAPSVTINSSTTYTIRLTMIGTALSLYWNGTLITSVSDSTYSSAGFAGIAVGQPNLVNSIWDNFSILPNTNSFSINDNLVATSTGALGIGTTSPSYAIDVENGGSINTNGSYLLNGASINTAGTLSNVAYLTATTQAFTGINTFSRNGSGASDATLVVSGTPVNNATSSLVRIGNSIASGNAATNGGTYIGLNEPSSGAGSAADFLNFQQNGISTFSVTGAGTATAAASILTPLLDTASAVALNVGTTNATVINLNQNTTVASNKSFTANGAATFKDATNATTAFQVQNSSAVNLFTVDTTNNALVVGHDGTSQTAMTIRGGAATGTNATGANLTIAASNGTGTGGSGDILFQTAGPAISTPTDDGNDNTGSAGSNTSLTFSHTVAVNSNRILVVGISTGCGFGGSCAATVSSVTYNGVGLTKLNNVDCSTGAAHCHIELWYLVGPATGANNVVISTSGTTNINAGASSYYNVDSATPFGTSATGTGSGNPSSLGVTSNTAQVVVDVITSNNIINSPSAGQTQRYNANSNGPIASSTKPGTASTTSMGWSDGSSDYATIGAGLNPPSGTTSNTLLDRLHITASGNVGINTATPGYTLDVNGGGNFASYVLAPVVDTASATTLTLGNTNATAISMGNTTNNIQTTVNGTELVKPTTGHDSTTAFRVQNAAAANLFTVDTTNTALVLGNDTTPAALTVRGGAASGSNVAGTNITVAASNGTGTGGSGDILFQTAAAGTPQFDANSSTTGNSVPSLTWSHTVASQSNRILVVGVATTLGQTVSTVTYNGVGLTKLTTEDCASTCHDELWYLKNPATGTNNIVVTFSASTSSTAAGATSYYNVDQTTPFGTAAVNTSGSTTPTVAVTTTANQLVIDSVASRSGAVLTVVSPQTQRWNAVDPANRVSAGSSQLATTTTTTMSWTSNTNTNWAEIGVGMNAAATATDTLSDRLHITAAGNIGINTATPNAQLQVATNGQSLFLGDNTNTSVSIGLNGSTRGMVGYDGTNAVLQGGSGHGVKLNVNNSTFGSGTVVTINSSGAALFENNTNSTTAFQVQNSSAANLFTVDTTNTALVLGNDTTPAALTVRGGAASGSNVAGTNITFDASNGTGTGGSGDFIFRTAPATTTTPVTFDSSNTFQSASSTTSYNFNYAISGHANRAIFVTINAGTSVLNMQYNGVSMTKINATTSPGIAEMWYQLIPGGTAAGTYTLNVTFSSNSTGGVGLGVAGYYNVASIGSQVTATGTSTTSSSVSVTATTLQLVTDGLVTCTNTPTVTSTGQTSRYNNSAWGSVSGSDKLGVGGTTTLTWSFGGTCNYEDFAVPLNPVATGGSSADTLANNLHITSSGNVQLAGGLQVGADTAPGGLLDVQINGSTNFSVQNNTNATGGWNIASTILRIGKDSGTSRSINAAGTINASGADYAEYFYQQTDGALQKGDVVTLNPSGKVEKGTPSDQIMGVVSTNAGFVGNDLYDVNHPEKTVLVGLVGQIPTFVTAENGQIHVGDALAPSKTIPGAAMKATSAGMTIGKALEDYTNADTQAVGQITVFVSPTWYDPAYNMGQLGSLSDQISQLQGQVANLTQLSGQTAYLNRPNVFKGDGTHQFEIQNTQGQALFVADTTNMKVTVANLIVTGDLTVNGHIIAGGTAPTIAAGSSACVAPAVVIAGSDTAGMITVTTGTQCANSGKLATITFANAFAKSPEVVVTPADEQAGDLQTFVDSATISTTAFDLVTTSTSKPAATTVYKWYYHVIQ